MNFTKLQFGKTEIAVEELFIGVLTASMALCSGFYIWGMLFLSSSQNQMELYLTKGVWLCGVVSVVSAGLAVMLCLCVAAVIVPAVAAGTFEALRPICRELVDRVRPESLGQGGGGLALPECATHSVRAPNDIVYQYGGEPLQSACIRLERRCQEVLASEIPAVIWCPKGENLVKIYSRKSDGTIQSVSPTREAMELPGIQYPADFVFANETESQYHQFLSAVCTGWDNNQTKYRAMREAQTGVDRFLSFAKAPSAVLNAVLFLLCLVPSVLSANIISDVQNGLPKEVLFQKPDKDVSVVFTFEKLPVKRTGDGQKGLSDLLASEPSFDADANFGRFISVSIGGYTYAAIQTSAAPKPLFERASAALPDSAQGGNLLKRADQTLREVVPKTGEQVKEISDSYTFQTALILVMALSMLFRQLALIALRETIFTRTGRAAWGARWDEWAQFFAFWAGMLFIACLVLFSLVWLGMAVFYDDWTGAFAYVFNRRNLPLVGFWFILVVAGWLATWYIPNPKPTTGAPNRPAVIGTDDRRGLNSGF